jgi:hypothetical protein
MFMISAFTLFGSWNTLRSIVEATEAWAPNWAPGVLRQNAYPKLTSDKERLSELFKLAFKKDEKHFKLIRQAESTMVACAHGNSKAGIIGIHPHLLEEQISKPRYIPHLPQTKFNKILDSCPIDPTKITAYLSNLSIDDTKEIQTNHKTLRFDLSKEEKCFVLAHEKFHLTDDVQPTIFKISTAARFAAFGAAEWLAHQYAPSSTLAGYALHAAFYLVSCYAVASCVRYRQEMEADRAGADKYPEGAKRYFKRILILDYLNQKPSQPFVLKNVFWNAVKFLPKLTYLEEAMAQPSIVERLTSCCN